MNQFYQTQIAYDQYLLKSPNVIDVEMNCCSTNEQSSKRKGSFVPFYSAQKTEMLPKPDFSSLEKNEHTLEFKQPGSYKKQKILFPQTPIKSPMKNWKTPNDCDKQICVLGKDQSKKPSACRKLNFFSNDDEEESKNPSMLSTNTQKNKKKENNFQNQLFDCFEDKDEDCMSVCPTKKSSMFGSMKNFGNYTNTVECDQMCIDDISPCILKSSYEKSGKFDSEFIVIKTLSTTNTRNVSKCIHIQEKKLYVIKKNHLHQQQNDKETLAIQKFIKEAEINKQSCFAKYCSMYLDYWEEKIPNDTGYISFSSGNDIYALEKYYPNGDLLDYLSKLEKEHFAFTKDFYWDIIFEMLCGVLHLHECGFIHFDIQPSNFFIDSNGDVKLGGFALCKSYTDLLSLFTNKNNTMISIDDFFEGDSVYLAPELFNRSTVNDISYKCDVFSLGLAFLEIICKINLPKNGKLWQDIRSPGFQLHSSFFANGIMNDISILALIQRMITVNVNERANIIDLFNDSHNFPELNMRYQKIFCNNYHKTSLNLIMNYLKNDCEEEEELFSMEYDGDITLINAKRSNSSKLGFFNK